MSKIIGNTTTTPVPRSDWAQTDPKKVDYILNKPIIGPSDWNQTDETKNDYIKNKPELGILASQDEVAKDFLSADVQESLARADSVANTYETKDDAFVKLDEAKDYADSAVADLKNELLNGAGEAYDTLKELGELIDENTDAIGVLETIATGKADASHVHDDRYYTESEIDVKFDTHNTATDAHNDIRTAISNKVDKVDGKGLSTNDYTSEDKGKLTGIEAGAQVNVQPDWLQTDDTKSDYIKNKPVLDSNFIILIDQANGFEHGVQIVNGNLVSFCRCTSIAVTTPPDKVGYMEGDEIDTTGMVVTATCQDGSTRQLENYVYSPLVMTPEVEQLEIRYVECGQEYTASTTIGLKGIADLLMDFEYEPNGDGTYTITSWSGTLNGEPSTEFILPDSDKIVL